MKKRNTILICILIVVAMVFSACGAQESKDTPEADPSASIDEAVDEATDGTDDATIVIAEVNGEPIYKDAYNGLFSSYCAQWGIDENAEEASTIQEMVMQSLVSDKVLTNKLKELGYMDLTDDQIAQAEQNTQDMIADYILNNYMPTIQEELGEDYTDEELQAKMVEYEELLLSSSGITKEEVIEEQKNGIASEAAYTDLVGDIKPTDKEVEAQYTEYMETDQEQMTQDPTMYISSFSGGNAVYYVPGGVRNVRQVLIKLDEDANGAINTLRQAGYDDAAEILLANALATIQEKSDDILSQLQSGKITFDEAIETYNDDLGMPSDGYPIVADTTTYVPSFTEAAMALKNIGDITELVPSDFGYHIIEYASDIPEGALDYESVKDDIYDELLLTLQGEEWSAVTEKWEADSEIVYYNENL